MGIHTITRHRNTYNTRYERIEYHITSINMRRRCKESKGLQATYAKVSIDPSMRSMYSFSRRNLIAY